MKGYLKGDIRKIQKSGSEPSDARVACGSDPPCDTTYQMIDKDLRTDRDKDYASRNLNPPPEEAAEAFSQKETGS